MHIKTENATKMVRRRGAGGTHATSTFAVAASALMKTSTIRTCLLMLVSGYVGFLARTVVVVVKDEPVAGGGGIGGGAAEIIDASSSSFFPDRERGGKKYRSLREKSVPMNSMITAPLSSSAVAAAKEGAVKKREAVKGRRLPSKEPTKKWERTKFTLDDFVVAGVNLATYQMDKNDVAKATKKERAAASSEPFELYEDFDIADQITGNEGWWDLVKYRQRLRRPSLSFYIDKIAQRRWLPRVKMVDITGPLTLKYRSELGNDGDDRFDLAKAIFHHMPKSGSFVAKPTHLSCSSGVWLVDLRGEGRYPLVAEGGHTLEEDEDWCGGGKLALDLATSLGEKMSSNEESWALLNVKPGVVFEERYAAGRKKYEDRPAMEFKVFCIWGRVWLANWRMGSRRWGLVHRNGTVVDWSGYQEDHSVLPDFVDWDRVVQIAELLGANKDMYRTDIFVGMPVESEPEGDEEDEEEEEDNEKEDKDERLTKRSVRVVVSETEIHPTTSLKDPGLFEEAARLWIAGYRMGNYRVVTNDEVPLAFVANGVLTEEDVENLVTVMA